MNVWVIVAEGSRKKIGWGVSKGLATKIKKSSLCHEARGGVGVKTLGATSLKKELFAAFLSKMFGFSFLFRSFVALLISSRHLPTTDEPSSRDKNRKKHGVHFNMRNPQ